MWQIPEVLEAGERVVDALVAERFRGFEPRHAVFFDLDNMYPYNKALGHEQGDLLIGAFWEILVAEAAGHGYLMRFGGDEFMWITDLEADDVRAAAGRIRVALLALPDNPDERNVGVSCAYGAIPQGQGRTALEGFFFSLGECAQDTAKSLGKDRLLELTGVGPDGRPRYQVWEWPT